MNEIVSDENANENINDTFSSEDFIKEVEQLSYEQARQELVNIVNKLENGNLPLQHSMELWKKGEILVSKCRNFLEKYQNEIDEKIKVDSNQD